MTSMCFEELWLIDYIAIGNCVFYSSKKTLLEMEIGTTYTYSSFL